MQSNVGKRKWLIDHLNALPYTLLFALWGSTILLFAGIYTFLSYIPENGPTGLSEFPPLLRFANALYYSVITATNTGYGDIVPLGISRFFAGFQSIMELFLFALFVAKLVSNRQDAALQEVHKIAFELTFRNVREDLYVARKDFDRVIEVIQHSRAMTSDEWERLLVAFQHVSGLIHDIPNFYDVTSDLYIIDPNRETLLLESMQRTIARIHHMFEVMNEAHIDWRTRSEIVEELRKVVVALDEIIPLWQKHSHDQSHEAFVKIASAQDRLRAMI